MELKTLTFVGDLNELRHVANVVKHSSGPSLEALKVCDAVVLCEPDADRGDSIGFGPLGSEFSILGVQLFITVSDFDRYLSAVTAFWDHDRWRAAGERFYKKRS